MNGSTDTISKVEKEGSNKLNEVKETNKNFTRLIITDVSRMKHEKVCIFGVDAEANYIRPTIPYELVHEHLLYDDGKRIIRPFAMIDFDLIRHYPNPPHTEDYIMNPCSKPIFVRNLDEKEAKYFLETILDDDVKSIFGTEVINNQFIQKHRGNRSIGTVKVKKVQRIRYIKWKKQHRIQFLDSSGDKYDLPITDCAFYKYFKSYLTRDLNPEKINVNIRSILNESTLYLRIGLSRIVGEFKDHYLLVTGIYSFPDYKKGTII